jgi:hypothetical protein
MDAGGRGLKNEPANFADCGDFFRANFDSRKLAQIADGNPWLSVFIRG